MKTIQFTFSLLLLPFFVQFVLSQREPGLVAHFPLDGTLEEIDGQHPPIELHGNIELSTDKFGRSDKSYRLLDFLSVLQIPCETITDLLDFTISIWAKSEANQVDACLISIANGVSNAGNHFSLVGSEFWLSFGETSDTFYRHELAPFGGSVFKNEWQQFLITRNSTKGEVDIYINGEFIDNVNGYTEDRTQLHCEGFVLGNDQDRVLGDFEYDQQFYGSIADLRIYDKAFSKEDVKGQFEQDKTCTIKHCKTCSSDFESCVECKDPNAINEGTQCKCPEKHYMNTQTSICEQCGEHCQNCDISNTCTQCIDSDRGVLQGETCVCPEEFYMDENSLCQPCNPNCKTCTDLNTCTVCKDSINAIIVDGNCECQSGWFMNNSNFMCSECNSHCEACLDENTCTQCIDTSLAFISQGVCNCPVKYYMEISTSLCKECGYRCEECQGNADNCLVCSDTQRNDQVNCECNKGYYEIANQKECLQCDNSECATCQNSPQNCIKRCNLDCKTCNTEGKCLSCEEGKYLDSEEGKCLSCDNTSCATCQNTAQNCIKPCESKCGTCDIEGKCLSCKDEMELSSEGQCTCGTGYFSDSNSECQRCSPLCVSCEGSAENCTLCGFWVNRSSKIEENCQCLPGFYHKESFPNIDCQECEAQCAQCSENKANCTECVNDEFLPPFCKSRDSFVLKSVPKYEENKGLEPCLGKCLECQHNNDFCTKCSLGKYRKNNPPLCSCEDGYYDNHGQLQNCQKCSPKCQTCSNESACLSCKKEKNRVLNIQTQNCDCQEGFREYQGECMQCYYFQGDCYLECPQQTMADIESYLCYEIQVAKSSYFRLFVLMGLILVVFILFSGVSVRFLIGLIETKQLRVEISRMNGGGKVDKQEALRGTQSFSQVEIQSEQENTAVVFFKQKSRLHKDSLQIEEGQGDLKPIDIRDELDLEEFVIE